MQPIAMRNAAGCNGAAAGTGAYGGQDHREDHLCTGKISEYRSEMIQQRRGPRALSFFLSEKEVVWQDFQGWMSKLILLYIDSNEDS